MSLLVVWKSVNLIHFSHRTNLHSAILTVLLGIHGHLDSDAPPSLPPSPLALQYRSHATHETGWKKCFSEASVWALLTRLFLNVFGDAMIISIARFIPELIAFIIMSIFIQISSYSFPSCSPNLLSFSPFLLLGLPPTPLYPLYSSSLPPRPSHPFSRTFLLSRSSSSIHGRKTRLSD